MDPNQTQTAATPPANAPTAQSAAKSSKPRVNPNSTQDALQIAEIRENLVIMTDGSFRAVIMCRAINFDLISPAERESVEYAYQGFLNSLDFPIQIVVRSRKVNIQPYIRQLNQLQAEKSNMLLAQLMTDYLNFMVALAEETSIMDKTFYVVVPFHSTTISKDTIVKGFRGIFSNIFSFRRKPKKTVIDEAVLETAKSDLYNRIQVVVQGLGNCGVQTVPLDTQGLIELYYDSYNPDTATRQRLDDFQNLTETVIRAESSTVPPPAGGA